MRRLVVALVLLAACGRDSPDLASDGGGGWERLPDPPLAARTGAVVVWTGEDALVVGGDDWACPPNADCSLPDEPAFADGAAFDPATGEWRSIADAPRPIPGASTAVAQGAAWFLLHDELLRYDPAADEWSSHERPPCEWCGLVAAGDRLLAVAGSDEQGAEPDHVLDGGAWVRLPDDPLGPSFGRQGVGLDDGDLLLFAHDLVPNPGSEEPSVVRAARLDLGSGVWSALPDSDSLGQGVVFAEGDDVVIAATGGADGGEVNGWGRTVPFGAWLDLDAGRWVALPEPPPGQAFAAGALGATSAAYAADRGIVLDVADRSWLAVPDPQDPDVSRSVVAAGRDLVAVGGVSWEDDGFEPTFHDDAWIWRPESG